MSLYALMVFLHLLDRGYVCTTSIWKRGWIVVLVALGALSCGFLPMTHGVRFWDQAQQQRDGRQQDIVDSGALNSIDSGALITTPPPISTGSSLRPA